ncbi:2,3-bisphosphoglycerate-independent phosphoglycerate mutase [Chitinivibrio alkaliphilus]|uniref:2,3-bisphosphoglycerate-independent phosphoglycerate mutase n=1 Tax=Chitinivibrio alkaliphilus ACht1 TaxID=1313304 RepID=U7D8P7_9BACT|nr:2,3-bisphosphoglycerate-independent phosphoglycerate mutase [Chitinivibrio alkaliphilus]ERP30805.1 phosphoglyceromutase [Chitinivibrio alkaliphilus ACht1]
MSKRPLCLIIRDGWGRGSHDAGDLINSTPTPHADAYEQNYPTTCISASGEAVGLPAGIMGNSEVGHLNIGAGRVVYQSLTRIEKAVDEGDFFSNEAIVGAIHKAKENNGTLHLLGLVQDAGVHANTKHALAILEVAKKENFHDVLIHVITDGRDTPPKSALEHVQFLQDGIDRIGVGRIATLTGRYYAMDRDTRWERTELAYAGIMHGTGSAVSSWREAIDQAYEAGENDEFIKPRVIEYDGIGKNDSMLFFNYRFDRTRQLTKAIVESDFSEFPTTPHNIHFVAMTHYYDDGNFEEVFPEQEITNNFGETLSKAGLKQLRCAETEKYAHVTFFFNSLKNDPYDKEDRVLVDSPRVATYDLQPEMSAKEVRDKLLKAISDDSYDVIITNFANCDMVGHTGIPEAIRTAITTVDDCVHDVVQAVQEKGGVSILTADHGNADETLLSDGSPMTAHSKNPVPLTIVGLDADATLRDGGSLCDIAPTCLDILGLPQPKEMTGATLLQ